MTQHHGHTHDHQDYPAFFEHKELIVLVEHDQDLDAAWVDEWLQAASGDFGLSCRLSLKRGFSAENYQPFTTFRLENVERNVTLIYVAVNGGNSDPEAPISIEERFEADTVVIRAVDGLIARIHENPVYETDRMRATLRAASPNWMFSAAPHQLIDGGPGGRPVEVKTPMSQADYQIHCPLAEQVVANHVVAFGTAPNRVTVAILDAVPPKGRLEKALDKISPHANPLLHATAAQLKRIVRREDLSITLPLEPSTVPPAPGAAYTSHSADYDISDHGLFVAGTVHSLAPEADLMLFEVLNHYGIGTVETLAKGISAIWGSLPSIPAKLIVNCSLCISFQSHCELVERYAWDALDVGGKGYLNLLLQPLRDAINSLFFAAHADTKNPTEVRIVAAAGNDGHATDNIPPFARFPAAFDEVLGIGALVQRNVRAEYSNLTDNPTTAGVLVFGGGIVASNPPMSNANEGMLGLYIGDFPGNSTPPAHNRSQYGWGRWAGTSFATGVMSGLLAGAAVSGMRVRQGVATSFHDAVTAGLAKTSFSERILESWQG